MCFDVNRLGNSIYPGLAKTYLLTPKSMDEDKKKYLLTPKSMDEDKKKEQRRKSAGVKNQKAPIIRECNILCELLSSMFFV